MIRHCSASQRIDQDHEAFASCASPHGDGPPPAPASASHVGPSTQIRLSAVSTISTTDFQLAKQFLGHQHDMSRLAFDAAAAAGDSLLLAGHGKALPILVDSSDNEAIHVAVNTFAQDIERVTGVRPEIYQDKLPAKCSGKAIIAATAGSPLASIAAQKVPDVTAIKGKWESYHTCIVDKPCEGVEEGLMILGSDRVSAITILL
jgi:hypothetical protein